MLDLVSPRSEVSCCPQLPPGPTLLFVGHPGHELRVWGWLALARPTVLVLTDGSGRSGASRLEHTRRTVEEVGARPGSLWGPFTDRDVYEILLGGRISVLLEVLDEVEAAIEKLDISCVAGDSCEGYNPTHDVCRLILQAAVARVERRRGARLPTFDFPLRPGRPLPPPPGALTVQLSERAMDSKEAAARRCPDLAIELGEALQVLGRDAFRTEVLSPRPPAGPGDGLPDVVPFYESHGESRVQSGKYQHVIRRGQHVLPVAAALWSHAHRGFPL